MLSTGLSTKLDDFVAKSLGDCATLKKKNKTKEKPAKEKTKKKEKERLGFELASEKPRLVKQS